MGATYQKTAELLSSIDPTSVFVEIGSDRMEGSTLYFANLAEQYNTVLHTVDITAEPQSRIKHSAICWHVGIGSNWCKNVWPTVGKEISVLYLDNFDYDWNSANTSKSKTSLWNKNNYDNIKGPDWPEFTKFDLLPKWIQEEISEQHNMSPELILTDVDSIYEKNNLIVNNNNCQLEHFNQIRYLYPWLSDNCLVVFDDTYTYNDCWIGKNGPGVIFLQANGFEIIWSDKTGIILTKR